MANYRFFFVGTDGHITGRIEQDCDDDLAAMERAGTLATSAAIEVWDAARYVGRVKRDNGPLEDSDRTAL